MGDGDFDADLLGEGLGEVLGGVELGELGGVLGLGEWDRERDTEGVGDGVWLAPGAGTAGKIRAAEKYADHHTLRICTTCPKVGASTI